MPHAKVNGVELYYEVHGHGDWLVMSHEFAGCVKSWEPQIPAFAHRLPRPRRGWTREDDRQTLFDAVALGLTYFTHGTPSPYVDDFAA